MYLRVFQDLEKDVKLNADQLDSISALLRRVRKTLDDYLIELNAQYPDVKVSNLDAPELGDTLSRLQVRFSLNFCHLSRSWD